MKDVIVVELTPEMKSTLQSFGPTAESLKRLNDALEKAVEQIDKARARLEVPARLAKARQRPSLDGRRRFPIPRSQKVR